MQSKAHETKEMLRVTQKIQYHGIRFKHKHVSFLTDFFFELHYDYYPHHSPIISDEIRFRFD